MTDTDTPDGSSFLLSLQLLAVGAVSYGVAWANMSDHSRTGFDVWLLIVLFVSSCLFFCSYVLYTYRRYGLEAVICRTNLLLGSVLAGVVAAAIL